MLPLLNISSGLGLSGAAGLNAYIPLLLTALLANRGIIHLNGDYAILGNQWCVTILILLCAFEFVVDKLPVADHINNIVSTAIRPAAAAILFGSQSGAIPSIPPWVCLLAGAIVGGTVHTAKSVGRPVVNVALQSHGRRAVSATEDAISAALSALALFAPILCILAVALFACAVWWTLRRTFRRRTSLRLAAPAPASPPP